MTEEIKNQAKQPSTKIKYFIVLVCMLIQAIPFGIAQNIQPLFIPYVVKGFHFSLGGFCLIFTIGALASSICSPFIGKLFGKVNLKAILLTGSLLSGLGFLGFGLSQNLGQFYFCSAVSQIGCLTFSGLGIPFVINSWFPNKGRGKALGIAFSGGSIGNIFLQQIVSHLLGTKGFSYTYILFGIIAICVSTFLILFFIRTPKPGELEASIVTENKDNKQEAVLAEGPGAAAVRKDPFFWVFAAGYLLIAISIAALSTQYATYFTNGLHLGTKRIGMLGSVFALFCLFGNVFGGMLFDKIGSFKAMFIAMILQALAIVALILAPSMTGLAFLFSICYGSTVFSYMSAPAFMATDLFGKKESSVILGMICILFAVGFAFGSTLFGLVVDFGGFRPAWAMVLVCVLVGYSLLLTGIKKAKDKYQF